MFRCVKKLEKALASLPTSMNPQLVDGKWRKPELSKRSLAELRKAALAMGREWVWDPAPKDKKERDPRGHKNELNKHIREVRGGGASC